MGASDLIPGISGGTIAFVMGFYKPLLESLKSFDFQAFKLLLTGQWQKFLSQTKGQFLFTLLAGILVSFVLMVNTIQFLLNHPAYRVYLYSAFFGLILASFYFCMRQVRDWNLKNVVGLTFGLLSAFTLTSLSTSFKTQQKHFYAIQMDIPDTLFSVNNYRFDQKLLTHLSSEDLSLLLLKKVIHLNTRVYDGEGQPLGRARDFVTDYHRPYLNFWLICCGAIAICALLLPGISGSYILTLLGAYPLIISSLADWVFHLQKGRFDLESFTVLMNLGLGILMGIALFSRLLSWLLKSYPDLTLATLSGFMIGAIRSVWPFWSYDYTLLPTKLEKGLQIVPLNPMWPTIWSFQSLFALFWLFVGFYVLWGIEFLAKRKQAPPNS